ncbi:MAG: 5-carboxymethyl-2-hydroxymuconate Delta-isomerase [Allomuricauda sp.]
MPHFIIDCSDILIKEHDPAKIMAKVYEAALSSELFDPQDIKVRINPYTYYSVNNGKSDFIHVFAYILEGRSAAQKEGLSKRIVSALNEMFSEVPVISMNIMDFEKATYCNKSMV